MKLQKYQKCSKVTRGLRKAEFVLKNARIVNVFTREILKGDIAIEDGLISGIGSYEGKREIDLEGRYVCPGLIDSHLHMAMIGEQLSSIDIFWAPKETVLAKAFGQ